ncbi:MAG: hypothetical protein GY794_24770 [bacterium]|nr:hypothetical protein [bacterium]
MARKTRKTYKRTSRKSAKPSFIHRWWDSVGSDRQGELLRVIMRVVILCAVVFTAGWGLTRLETHLRDTTSSKLNAPVRLEVTGTPSWMPTELAYRIAKSFAIQEKQKPKTVRYDDANLSDAIAAQAAKNPWVRKVKSVRKARDASGRPFVRVDCEFRKPAAMVAWRSRYYFVDDQGVRLKDSRAVPEVPRWIAVIPGRNGKKDRQENFIRHADIPAIARGAEPVKIRYIIIELDDQWDPPAPKPGELWDSKALREGLRLAVVLKTQKYARKEVDRVDARNYGGRRSPVASHLSFSAGSANFKFGRFPASDYHYNVSTRRKMKALDSYAARYNGRLTDTPGMDLRLGDPYE